MKQPDGYIIKGKENLACRLNKSLYGLKQAAKVWNDQLHNILIKNDFCQSKNDMCMYVSKNSKQLIYILIYVDDILIASKEEKEIQKFQIY